MNCESANRELVEAARSGAALSAEVSAHCAGCEACQERREAETALSGHFRAMRQAVDAGNVAWSKAVLLREFDRQRRHERQVRWMWAMSSAAVLVLSVVAVRDTWMKPVTAQQNPVTIAKVFAPREYPQEAFGPAEDAGEKGFIKVPFALPPAPGETFGIVRTQLDPTDLARMGVSVDPGWTGTLQADLLVGEDGFTQAVRISNDDSAQTDGQSAGDGTAQK